MDLFIGICTIVGACYVLSFLFKALGKVACWVVGGVFAIAGAVLLGSAVLVAVYFLAVLAIILIAFVTA